MSRTRKRQRPPSAESIARLADQGRDVSQYFTNRGRMVRPAQAVSVGFPSDMVAELDAAARELNVSRQDIIKLFIRRALDEHHSARKARTAN